MNYYSHHIGDYRRDTSHLSLLEHGVYRTLLDLYYLNETPIPKITDWVFRRLSARTNEEILAIQAVLKDFFVEGVDGYTHKRCDMELREYSAKADTARHNGKLGGRPKKTRSIILGNPDTTQIKANQEPITTNHKPIEDEADAPLATARLSPCPQLEILKLFNQVLPSLAQPRPELWLQSKNASSLAARWRWLLVAKKSSGEAYATNSAEACAWFERFFNHVSESDFLMGKTVKPFACTLAWLVNATNFVKVVEGNYDGVSA